MSHRLLNRGRVSATTNEATRLFDEIDRWHLAERHRINGIHAMTRLQIYESVAAGRRCARFQEVMRDLIGGDKDPAVPDDLVVVNWDEFTNDLDPNARPDYGSLKPLAHVQRWLRDVIAHHCPFVQPSLNHGRIWLSVIPPEQTNGFALMEALHRGRTAFRNLSAPGDRNTLLNALVLAVPEIPKLPHWTSPRQYLGEYKQDFGAEIRDVEIGAFSPAEPVTATADPLREAPPVFVFRHLLSRTQKGHHVLRSVPEQDRAGD